MAASKADLIEPVDVRAPPGRAMGKVAELWTPHESGKIVCTACARYCKIGEGQVGLCGVRGVHDGKLWLYVYGRVITGHVDPIEKKPVMHYRPGSKIFSIATTGCNWLCHPAGTRILMADGTTKPVEDVTAGDALWSVADMGGRTVPDIVTEAGLRKAAVLRVSVEGLHVPLHGTPDHPVLSRTGWKKIGELASTDSVLVRNQLVPWEGLNHVIEVPRHGLAIHPQEMTEFSRRLGEYDTSAPVFRWSRVLGVSQEAEKERVYSFECVPFHNYVADDVLVHNCRYCFVPGTPVFTDRGRERIESIFSESRPTEKPEIRTVENRSAYTHRGRWRTITNAFEHFYSGPVLKVHVRGLDGFECTPDHRVFASVDGGGVKRTPASLLKRGDLLAIPRPSEGPVAVIDGAIRRSAITTSEAAGGLLFLRATTVPIGAPGFVLVPIEDITERLYVGPVYNIEVEDDHSYTADFLAVANCQNFDISQRRKVEGIEVEPKDVVRMTLEQGCQGLAYTYNQPTIFIEFARDIGMAARKAGLINIFVSNGYDTPDVVEQFPKFLDAITVDFKGSGETEFVRKYIGIPNADPIFDTLQRTRDTKATHIEITDLIVPQVGDSLDAARKLSKFVYDELGPDTPIHFLRFHPDYKMNEFPWTPVETLEKHCEVAKEAGLKYVYIGNVAGHALEHTYCPGCGTIAIRRYGFDITGWYLDKHNRCKKCGYALPIVGALEKTFREDRFYSVLHHR